ncbi:MAG: hypothetical protein CBD97_01640 [Pelagibacteraceae bacterium TMED237]|nr:MAG: hypothetical protein CBD97_01640 [Pelagibacteraceae bacterium TMED237]|tara:strand:- start:17711 stop:17995 length:285 start_codon:yes stop_codon:yes gene_type:complete
MQITKDKAKKHIYATNGKIFSAVFIKKDGERRLMNCRLNVKKYVKGVGRKFKPSDKGLIGVFDLQKDQHRFINLNTLESLKINGVEYNIKNEDK